MIRPTRSRALGFARAVRRRRAGGVAGGRPVRRQLLRQAAPARLVRQRLELHTRIQVVLARTRPAEPRAQRRGAPIPGAEHRRSRPLPPRTVQPAERLAARGVRIEATAVPGIVASRPRGVPAGSAPAPAVALPTARPVLRLLRQPQAPPDPAEPAPAAHGSIRMSAPRSPEFSPAEVERLAQRVMSAIDRRLVAFRERHGRS